MRTWLKHNSSVALLSFVALFSLLWIFHPHISNAQAYTFTFPDGSSVTADFGSDWDQGQQGWEELSPEWTDAPTVSAFMNEVESYLAENAYMASVQTDANGDILEVACTNGSVFTAQYASSTTPATSTASTTNPTGDTGGGGGGLTQNGSSVSSCGIGYTTQGSECIFTSCPTGYAEGHDGSGNPDCAFDGCPTGYLQQGDLCIQHQCFQGYVCGADGDLYLENASCNEVRAQTCSYGCSGNACSIPASSADIIAQPTIVKTAETTDISWQAENVKSCTVAGTNGDTWSCSGNTCNATTTEQSSAIQAQTTYTLSCTGLDGSSLEGTAIVNVVPSFEEQ